MTSVRLRWDAMPSASMTSTNLNYTRSIHRSLPRASALQNTGKGRVRSTHGGIANKVKAPIQ